MNTQSFEKAVSTARKESKKRNFSQKLDLIVNLKGLDFKKPEHQVDFFTALPKSKGKETRTCALVGPELAEDAKANCTVTITQDEFEKYKDKKLVKKLANDIDFFIAQANIMAGVATVFGRVLGPRNKMPNPKAGCVVPPKSNLKPLIEKLQKTVRVSARKFPLVQVLVGNEEMSDKEIAENAASIFEQLVQHLPNGNFNVKNAYVKTTMGKAVKVTD